MQAPVAMQAPTASAEGEVASAERAVARWEVGAAEVNAAGRSLYCRMFMFPVRSNQHYLSIYRSPVDMTHL